MIALIYQFTLNTIMLIIVCVLGVSGEISSIGFYSDVMVFRTLTYGGVAVGNMILLNEDYDNEWIQHEYGHLKQERMLNVLYLPIVGIPSVIARLTQTYMWPETWADELGRTP